MSGAARPGPPRLLLDWDGTVTETDTLHMLLGAFGDPETFRASEGALGSALTLHEVIAYELATVTATLPEVVDWLLANVRIRPGFHELVARHRPVVVSAGFHELIEPILGRERITVELRANRLQAHPDGWRCTFASTDRCPVCGEACKRAVVADLASFDYVGDGFSDRCVSRAARRVFARAGLAADLDREGVPYTPFRDLHDVVDALAAEH